MTIDIAKVTELLQHHFATVTPEEFRANLEKFCPELFEEEEDRSNGNEDISPAGEDDRFGRADASRSPSPVRQMDLLDSSDEIYQQGKQDSKKEIAAKLLHRGISIEKLIQTYLLIRSVSSAIQTR
jgi:hypothetical protein